ncbi:MAG: N-acetylmuramoyl-L-alanine amidase, partial [Pyrinomonadaceae bacterium]
MRDPKKVYALVLHQMACCFKVKNPLTRFLERFAPHFAILPDGRILQLHPVHALTAASNGFNSFSVAVEFAGNFPNVKGKWWFDKKATPAQRKANMNHVTPAQIEAGRWLVRYLKDTMGLRMVVAHRQSSETRENDPGPDIWYRVGQWAIDNLGLSDGGPGYKVGTGAPIPDLWRKWGQAKPQPELEINDYELEEEELTIDIAPKPDISQVVKYMNATVRARGTLSVPTKNVQFLRTDLSRYKSTWWKRLWLDPSTIFPKVRVGVELIKVDPNIGPRGGDRFTLTKGLNHYVSTLGTTELYLMAFFTFNTKKAIEKQLGIPGQLDKLVPKQLTPQDQQTHVWLVYALFPKEIRRYVVPDDQVVLDKFAFDKSSLTKTHAAQIQAIARHLLALTGYAGSGGRTAVALVGHTDNRGKEKYNVGLGDRRAAAVKEALLKEIDRIEPGLSKQVTIKTRTLGEKQPLVKGGSEDAHARNRRVEVLL